MPTLVCLNRKHYQEKLQADEVDYRMEALDRVEPGDLRELVANLMTHHLRVAGKVDAVTVSQGTPCKKRKNQPLTASGPDGYAPSLPARRRSTACRQQSGPATPDEPKHR